MWGQSVNVWGKAPSAGHRGQRGHWPGSRLPEGWQEEKLAWPRSSHSPRRKTRDAASGSWGKGHGRRARGRGQCQAGSAWGWGSAVERPGESRKSGEAGAGKEATGVDNSFPPGRREETARWAQALTRREKAAHQPPRPVAHNAQHTRGFLVCSVCLGGTTEDP